MNDQNNNQTLLESLSPVMQRSIVLLLIHDMLPWDMDESGMTPTEIQQRLSRLGIDRPIHSLNRDLRDLMSFARVHPDDEKARPRRFHRFQEQRVTDCMPEPIRELAAPVLEVPDWPSQILMGR